MSELADKKVRSFTDLQYWQKSHRLYLDALQDVRAFPLGERGVRELADQLLRCVGSISANIAEGFGSDSSAEYCRYLTIARKSCAEAQNWYLKAGAAGFIQTANLRASVCEEVSRMIYAARETVRRRIESQRNGAAARNLQHERRVDAA